MDKEIIIAMENWLSERIEPLVEKLAKEMEPLAVSMAALADDTREVLKQTQDESKRQSQAWADKLQVRVKEWELKQQAQAATKATRGFTWRRWLKVVAVSS